MILGLTIWQTNYCFPYLKQIKQDSAWLKSQPSLCTSKAWVFSSGPWNFKALMRNVWCIVATQCVSFLKCKFSDRYREENRNFMWGEREEQSHTLKMLGGLEERGWANDKKKLVKKWLISLVVSLAFNTRTNLFYFILYHYYNKIFIHMIMIILVVCILMSKRKKGCELGWVKK